MATPLTFLSISILCLLSAPFCASTSTNPGTIKSSAEAVSFIKSQCSTTTYPNLCVECLSSYASTIGQSQKELAQAALSVSVVRSKAARDFVVRSARLQGLRKREAAALKDCLDEIGDSVDRLSRSVEEMKQVQPPGSKGKEEFVWHVSNVETWVSAALTDENTCMDGFSGKELDGSIKTSIRTRILSLAQVTSNALALVNSFASKYY
ncbi:hypothetical protein SAY87_011721 [Trapa incisa]|uniref:Pectinesterase inhibitor domain-containing protein n=2 Tax=Trapa TaxID=22665 RepID=A0AAN7MJ44_TRANT|nr:hypothetical protein SAY87_011721 [Trapa incisa]KAK4796461.1 hypothetical protein SAY86_028787 [Trapa natans]